MQKEIIICIVIILLIVIGNYVTGNYELDAINNTTNSLNDIKKDIEKENVDEKEVEDKLERLNNCWNDVKPTMAYFIEHDELEKVETSLTVLTSFCKTKEYTQTISEIDKCVFVLEHIREKNEFNLENIF